MNSLQFSVSTGHAEDAQSVILLQHRQRLEHELLRFQQQKHERVRHERRIQVKSQLQQLELQVAKYEMRLRSRENLPNEVSSTSEESNMVNSRIPPSPHLDCNRSSSSWNLSSRQPSFQSPSLQDMLAKLIQQNEDLKVLVLAQQGSSVSGDPTNLAAKDRAQSSSNDQRSLSVKFDDTEVKPTPRQPEVKLEPGSTPPKAVISFDKQQQKSNPHFDLKSNKWSMSLPEIDWTDEDELMLQKLDSGDMDVGELLLLPATSDSSKATAGEGATNSNKTAERDRAESRKRLTKLINASMKTATIRKPRWRLEMETETGAISPFSDQEVEPMKQLQIFRSAAYAVGFTTHLRMLLRTKKLEQKEKAMQDFESMLNVYFEATRIWLGKVVRNPLLSILQDPALDLDLSVKSSSKGLSNKFGALFTLRSKSTSASSTGVDEGKFVKLKVRVKGIVDAIAKAVDRQDIPAGILEFWKRLTSDGLYFPESYKLFLTEKNALEFDELGATRRISDLPPIEGQTVSTEQDASSTESTPATKAFSRYNIVLVNFLFVRILIPHIILQPAQVGIGPARMSKLTASNLKNLATTFYQICGLLSPLPPLMVVVGSSVTPRRSSATMVNRETGASEATGDIDLRAAPGENQFLSIDDIGQLLIPNTSFPVDDLRFKQFAQEQQVRAIL